MVQERNIAVAIILTVITCGLYGIYWMIKLQDESLIVAKEEGTSGAMTVLLTIVTCGIYGYYWSYKLGERIDKINRKDGNGGLIFIILQALGLGVINYCIAQSTLNTRANAL